MFWHTSNHIKPNSVYSAASIFELNSENVGLNEASKYAISRLCRVSIINSGYFLSFVFDSIIGSHRVGKRESMSVLRYFALNTGDIRIQCVNCDKKYLQKIQHVTSCFIYTNIGIGLLTLP